MSNEFCQNVKKAEKGQRMWWEKVAVAGLKLARQVWVSNIYCKGSPASDIIPICQSFKLSVIQ